MSPKISFWLLLRLAVLLAAVLVQSSQGSTFEGFLRKHIEPQGPGRGNLNNYCNRMMARRGMTRPFCKPTNTFIHGSRGSFEHLCRGGGSRATTKSRYRVTVCRNRGNFRRCNYRGQRDNKRIGVACRNRKPVHFAGLV